MTLAKFALVGFIAAVGFAAHADEGLKQDAKDAAHDVKTGAKKAGRDVSDKTCEMVNGKMECAGKKMKHKVQNAVDDVKK